MTQHKRGLARTQIALLPAALEDYVGAHALVRVIDAYVSGLDMVALGFAKSVPAARGRPSYAPDDLLALYVYGYWNRVRSSRRLEAECQRNVELMWLLGQLAPDHKTIAEFRRLNAQPFQAACAQFVQFLQQAQLVGGRLPVVAVDGSRFKASAAKKSVVDREQLARQRQKIEQRIADYMEELDEADRLEEGQVQPSPEQIEAALERLRRRGRKLDQAQAQLAAQAPSGVQTARVGLTDPDCVLLKRFGGGTLAGYNVQQAVDSQYKLIICHEVTTRGNDHTSLEPMAGAAQSALRAAAIVAVADCGYMNGAQAQACEQRGITPVVPMPERANTRAAERYAQGLFLYDAQTDSYRCPAGELLKRYKRDHAKQTDYYWTRSCAACALKLNCTSSKRRSIARSWFAAAAERAHGRAQRDPRLMRLRSATVEHPFGNLKALLEGGFSLRTLAKVKGEMALTILTYNLKRTLCILGTEQLLQKLSTSPVFSPA